MAPRWLLPFCLLAIASCRTSGPFTAPPPAPAGKANAMATGVPAGPGKTQSGLPWWKDRIFYEVFVRSFADSKTEPLAQDGIGDLQGLIEKRLLDLGRNDVIAWQRSAAGRTVTFIANPTARTVAGLTLPGEISSATRIDITGPAASTPAPDASALEPYGVRLYARSR